MNGIASELYSWGMMNLKVSMSAAKTKENKNIFGQRKKITAIVKTVMCHLFFCTEPLVIRGEAPNRLASFHR